MDSSTVAAGPDVSRHRILSSVVSEICLNAGFKEVHTFALETLVELMKTFICQLTVQSKAYAELQSRTEINFHDISSALIELGIDMKSFIKYARMFNSKHNSSTRVAEPPIILYMFEFKAAIAPIPTSPRLLRITNPKSHPNYIHDYFPEFPEPHTYIRTETEISHERDYQKTREQIANQKLNMQKSLVKFKIMSNLNGVHSIFNDDSSASLQEPMFSLIPNKPVLYSYLNALLTQDDDDNIATEL